MKKILIAATAAMLVTGAGLFGASAADKLKVGLIYLGPVGDLGWTYQHDLGRLEMVKAFGDKVETTFLENVSEGPDSERSIEQLARAGNKLIFTTSFGYMEPTLKVAKKYPNVHFEHATGYKRDKNLSTYSGRFYEGRYIQGIIAAKMSKSGVLGYIASFPIPEVVSGINATMLGAQTINPNIKIKVIWANTWFDPGKEADAAKALIDQGADVLMQHTDSPAAMQVAAERGKLAFGQDSEMIKFGPKASLPRSLAICIAAGESVCCMMTSAPWSISALAASASLPGSNQEFTQTILALKFGLIDCAPSMKELMPITTSGIGKETI